MKVSSADGIAPSSVPITAQDGIYAGPGWRLNDHDACHILVTMNHDGCHSQDPMSRQDGWELS
jgi:hypothetical protein